MHWAAPERHGYTDLHIVSWPPADLESTADETYIVEFAVDRQRQADPADRLIIVDVKIQEDNPTVAGTHIRRVLWSRGFMMREDMLHLLSSAGLCKLTTIQCTLKVNHNPWPPGDGVRRQMMHGDFVQLNVLRPEAVPSSHIQVALCEQEAADSQRFIYHASPTPSPEPTTPTEEAEGTRADGTTPVEDDHSDRASRSRSRRRGGERDENLERSASVSLLQQHVSYKSTHERSPLLDVTNTDLDWYVSEPLQEITSKIGPHSVETVKKPHVNDRWCATDTVQPIGSSFLQNAGDGQDGIRAIQANVEVKPPVVINLRDLIPSPAWLQNSSSGTSTCAVRLYALPGLEIPTILELPANHGPETLLSELTCWGHCDLWCQPLLAEGDFLGYLVGTVSCTCLPSYHQWRW